MTTTLHADRYSTTTTTRKNGVVVHDSEGSEGTLSWGQQASEQLAAFLRSPGDRPSPSRPGGVYGSGYHAVASETGGYIVLGEATSAPYHAPPVNPTMWSICMPGKAAQTREQWLDDVSRSYIRGVALYIVDRWNEDGRSWPLSFADARTLVSARADLAGHPTGYTSHAQVSLAWHKTDHTDPGSSFPWDVLAADIAALLQPIQPSNSITTEETIMQCYLSPPSPSPDGRPRAGAILTVDDRSKVRMSGVDNGAQADALAALGLPVRPVSATQYDALLALAQRDASS